MWSRAVLCDDDDDDNDSLRHHYRSVNNYLMCDIIDMISMYLVEVFR